MHARFALPLALTIVAAAPAWADAVKDLQNHARKLAGMKGHPEADDPAFLKAQELMEAVAKEGGAKAAKTLMALTRIPYTSPTVEITIATMARDALAGCEDEAARAEVYKALGKVKKKAEHAVPLLELVSGWPTEKTVAAVAPLLESKDPRIVMAAARVLGGVHLKASLEPLIESYAKWSKAGGEPVEALGRALYDITLQPLVKPEDWQKWWKDQGKEWTPEQRKAAESSGGTKQRPNHFQSGVKVPKFFGSLEVASRKLVIVMDVSGSMHIREYIKDPVLEEGEEGAGTSLAADPASALPKGIDPNADGYQKKKCSFNQCPAARGRKGATCPSDENLPEYYSRMARLSRAAQRLVKGLPKNTKFNMIAYSTETRTWKGKALTTASDSNKAKAIEWLQGLRAGGVTRSDVAIEQAFTFRDADTVIFVTDGAPTNAGGKVLDEEKVTDFLAEIRRQNRVRKVKIDVIAIAEGHSTFATELAEQNGGQYVTVD